MWHLLYRETCIVASLANVSTAHRSIAAEPAALGRDNEPIAGWWLPYCGTQGCLVAIAKCAGEGEVAITCCDDRKLRLLPTLMVYNVRLY